MSSGAIKILRWGGILVAIVFAIALAVSGGEVAEGEEISSAPETLYWVLLIIGVVAAIIGFVTKPKTT